MKQKTDSAGKKRKRGQKGKKNSAPAVARIKKSKRPIRPETQDMMRLTTEAPLGSPIERSMRAAEKREGMLRRMTEAALDSPIERAMQQAQMREDMLRRASQGLLGSSIERTMQEAQQREDMLRRAVEGPLGSSIERTMREAQQREDMLRRVAEGPLGSSIERAMWEAQKTQDVMRLATEGRFGSSIERTIWEAQKTQDIMQRMLHPLSVSSLSNLIEHATVSLRTLSNAADLLPAAELYLNSIYQRRLLDSINLPQTLPTDGWEGLRRRSLQTDLLAELVEGTDGNLLDEADTIFGKIVDAFKKRFSSAKSWIEQQSLITILMVTLTMFALYYQRASYLNDLQGGTAQEAASKNIEREFEKFTQQLNRLAEETARNRELPQPKVLLMVTRAANLRSEPSTVGKPVGKLYKGDMVEHMGSSGDWYHVKAHDPISARTYDGWIYAKLVRVVSAR